MSTPPVDRHPADPGRHLADLRLAGDWVRLRGMGYGLPQPVAIGDLLIAVKDTAAISLLDQSLSVLIGAQVPEGEGPAQPERASRAVRSRSPGEDARALAWRIGWWAGALQRRNRIPVAEQVVVLMPEDKAGSRSVRCRLVLPVSDHQAAILACRWVVDHARALLSTGSEAPLTPLPDRALREFRPPGINEFPLSMAAHRLGVPLSLMNPLRMLLLGTGRQGFLFKSTLTQRTSWLASLLASDKQATGALLRRAGLPFPEHRPADSPDAAVLAAEAIAYPVVIKPADRDRGEGVAADLRDAAAVRQAWSAARRFSDRILVERHLAGATHRLTVSAGQVVRVARRLAGGVVGDGAHSVRQLLALALLADDRVRPTNRAPLALDEEALSLLRQQGLDADSVPAAGRYLRLRRSDNVSTGGTSTEVPLTAVHPDNLLLACRAASVLRLDVAGVDLICEDIGVSWRDSGAGICEVNASPQIGATRAPEIFDAMVRDWVGDNPRIPAHLLVVDPDRQMPDAAALARLAASLGCNGQSSAAGLVIDGEPVSVGFDSGFLAAQALLRDPDVLGALSVMTVAEVLADGLPIDRFDTIRLLGGVQGGSRMTGPQAGVAAICRPAAGRFQRIQSLQSSTHEDS